MAPSRRQASRTAPSSSTPAPPSPFRGPQEDPQKPPQTMAPDELESQRQRMWLARAKRIDGVVFRWMEYMQELKGMEAIARENPGFQVVVRMCKMHVNRELRK